MRLSTALLPLILLQTTPTGKGSIEGRVLAAGSDQAIAGAEVRLAQPPIPLSSIPPVKTDGSGHFVFANVDPSTYAILATADGFALQEYGSRLPGLTGLGKALPLASGTAVKDVVIRLTPTSAVSGRVMVEGQPARGLEVRLVRPSYDATGRQRPLSGGVALTDDRGEYRIYGVTPGRYYLIAGPPTYDTLRNVPERGGARTALRAGARRYPVTFYPSALDPAKATLVEVRSGSELRQLDVTLVPQQPYRIRGRVLDHKTDQPLDGRVTVSWFPRDAPYGPNGSGSDNEADTKPDGTFETAAVVPGKYWLQVKAGQDLSNRQPRSQVAVQVEVIASDVDVVVHMAPSITLRGRITLDGQPLTTMPGMERAYVEAFPLLIGSVMLISPSRPTPRQPDGTFLFERIAPAEYQLRVGFLPPDVYVKSATLGALDVLSEGLLVPDATTELLDIVLSANGGRVDGTVRDDGGNPVDNVQAVLIPEASPNRTDLYRVANTDEKGLFTIRGITPGDYRVFAWEVLEPNTFFDPNVVRPFLERGTRAHVTESSRVTAAVRVIPGG